MTFASRATPASSTLAAPAPPRVRAIGATKSYGSTVALAEVNLTIGPGETVAIMGPSGSGKTTLALCLSGLVVPDRGEIHFGGTRIDHLSENQRSRLRLSRIGLVFQSGHLMSDLTAVENAALSMMFGGSSRKHSLAEAARWFEPLGLAGLEHRRPGELSVGQAQRVAIIRAIAQQPELLIADEPTAALDRAASESAMKLLVWLAGKLSSSLVVVTHDQQVAQACARQIDILDGRIVSDEQRVAGPTMAGGHREGEQP